MYCFYKNKLLVIEFCTLSFKYFITEQHLNRMFIVTGKLVLQVLTDLKRAHQKKPPKTNPKQKNPTNPDSGGDYETKKFNKFNHLTKEVFMDENKRNIKREKRRNG